MEVECGDPLSISGAQTGNLLTELRNFIWDHSATYPSDTIDTPGASTTAF